MIRNDNKGVNMDYKELLSVGCLITKDLKVFPINCNVPPETASEADEYMGVHIYDLTDEWWSNLSFVDGTDALAFIELNTYEIIEGPFKIWKEKKLDLIGCVDMLEVA
jgi:hypothetical protein